MNLRTPDDTHFPKVKAPSQYDSSDIAILKKDVQGNAYLIADIIESQQQKDQIDYQFMKDLMAIVYDTNFQQAAFIYEMFSHQHEHHEQVLNFFIWSTAHHCMFDCMSELIYTSSVLGYPITLQTYLKCALSLYDQEIDDNMRQQHLLYLYTIFSNESKNEGSFEHGINLFDEYLKSKFDFGNELYGIQQKEKKYKKKKRQSKRNSDDVLVGKNSGMTSNDMAKRFKKEARLAMDKSSEHYDPMAEQFFEKRSQSFPEMMSKAGSQLNKLNKKQQKERLKNVKVEQVNIENQEFEVYRDPLDGNVYVQLDPHQIEQYSVDDIQKMSTSFAKHVMQDEEYKNLERYQNKQKDAKILDEYLKEIVLEKDQVEEISNELLDQEKNPDAQK